MRKDIPENKLKRVKIETHNENRGEKKLIYISDEINKVNRDNKSILGRVP